MPSRARSTFEARHEQMFPTLDAAELERLRRFGEPRTYAPGERLVTTGEISPGVLVIVSGEVALSQHSVLALDQPILTYGPGAFLGELAQLSGQPALIDARATEQVDPSSSPRNGCATSSWPRPSLASASCAPSSCGASGSWRAAWAGR